MTATPAHSSRSRRFTYGLRASVLLLAITAVCIFLSLIASRASARIDVTVTRQHRLSPRTLDLLRKLDKPFEVVIAADPRTLDQATWQRTSDVLDSLSHASRNVSVTVLNTGSAGGLEKFESLMARLAERFKSQADAAAAGVESAAAATDRLADAIEGLSPQMLQVRKALEATALSDPPVEKPRSILESDAAMARVKADDLRTAAKSAREALARKAGPVPIPPTDEAARILHDPLADAAALTSRIDTEVRALASGSHLPQAATDALGPIATDAVGLRDRAARQVASLDAITHPALLRAARALQQTAAALVIAPPDSSAPGPGITAIDLDSILPVRATEGPGAGPAPDIRFRAEDLVTSAIASLNHPINPIIVFVHANPAPLGPDFRNFSVLIDRLVLHGASTAEWMVATEPDPPSSARLDPTGKRPIVYVPIPVGARTPDDAVRMGRLSNAVTRLVKAGAPVLLSVVPSTLPGTGSPDPMVADLPPLGLTVQSALPILRQTRTPTGRAVLPDHNADAAATDNPVAGAVRGLRTRLLWTCPITLADKPVQGVTATPILTVASSQDLWAEADWIGFADTWGRQGPGADLPSADSARDLRPTDKPWIVAAAAERLLPKRTTPQRLVAVCGFSWFEDRIAGLINPRANLREPGAAAAVLRSVGNIELAESAIYWLAGLDDLIAQSASAQAVPLIPDLSAAKVSVLRWTLIAGLPILILMLGATWRMLRG